MALSYVLYQNTTGTGPFNFSFPYISSQHVKVTKNGTLLTSGTDYTLSLNPTRITLTSPLVSTDALRIYRETPGRTAGSPSPLVDFTDGSVLTADDLDKNTQQLLYLLQEAIDTGGIAFGLDYSETNWNAVNRRITNVATPTSPADAATKSYVDGTAVYGTGAASPQSWSLTGDGTSVNFALSPTAAQTDPALFLVEIGGVIQRPSVDYTINAAGTQLQFLSGAPLNGQNIRVRNLGIVRNVLGFSLPVTFGVAANATFDGTATFNGASTFNAPLEVANTLYANTSNDRVGVGTTSPANNLHVHNSAGAVTGITVTNNTTGTTAGDGLLIQQSSAGSYFWNRENSFITLGANNAEVVRITPTGRVGIGTSTPAFPLDVDGQAKIGAGNDITPNSASNGHLMITGNGYAGYVALDGTAMRIGHNSTGRLLQLDVNETPALTVSNGGYVGVGSVTAPAAAIHLPNRAETTFTSDKLANQIRLWDAVNAVYGLGMSSGVMHIAANAGSNGSIKFWTGGTDTVAPSERLSISGDGDITISGDTVRKLLGSNTIRQEYSGPREWGRVSSGGTKVSGTNFTVAYSSGLYTVTFTTSMPDANYAVNMTLLNPSPADSQGSVISITNGSFTVRVYDGNGNNIPSAFSFLVHR